LSVFKYLNFSVTIGVGNEKNGLLDMAGSYKESIVALKSKLTIGRNRVITYASVADSEIKVNLLTADHRSRLLMNLRTGDGKEVQKLIERIFREIRAENIRHEILSVLCIEMVSACLEYIVEIGLNFKDILPEHRLNIIEEIQSKKSIDEMEGWVGEIFGHTLETAGRNRSSKTSKLIEEVKKYIKQNYQNDELSIDEIAKSLFVNYSYLSFIFKRDTGTTINEYLTEFRISRAKELFDCGNTLILDVAGRVGYADANYFGKCFKKYYGITPSRYIENKDTN
jgi:two-component system response regulator YesN